MSCRAAGSFRLNQLAPYDLDFVWSVNSKPNFLRANPNHRHHDRIAYLNPLARAPRKYQHSASMHGLRIPSSKRPIALQQFLCGASISLLAACFKASIGRLE
jgi:hypothetical protein